MKRIAGSILLILIIIFQFSGNGLLFHIQRSKIRREIKTRIKEGVSQDELEVLRFSAAELENLQWHNDHEFRHNGQMFDVVRREKRGDTLYLHCINDRQETVLFAQLSQLVKQRMDNGPARRQQQQMPLMLSGFYLPATAINLGAPSTDPNKSDYTYFFHIKIWKKPPDSPPPRFIF